MYIMKKGFTLAEVLVTLGVIGVIAAITLPTLTKDTTSAQIGPKLAKAVSAFEQANEALLNEYQVDRISQAGFYGSSDYSEALRNHIKITSINYNSTGANFEADNGDTGSGMSSDGDAFISKDGVVYIITGASSGSSSGPAHQSRNGTVWIDINGTAKPNEWATDVFLFALMDDGSLSPAGSTSFGYSSSSRHWTYSCGIGSIPNDPMFCAGHIFENNLKVLYR